MVRDSLKESELSKRKPQHVLGLDCEVRAKIAVWILQWFLAYWTCFLGLYRFVLQRNRHIISSQILKFEVIFKTSQSMPIEVKSVDKRQ